MQKGGRSRWWFWGGEDGHVISPSTKLAFSKQSDRRCFPVLARLSKSKMMRPVWGLVIFLTCWFMLVRFSASSRDGFPYWNDTSDRLDTQFDPLNPLDFGELPRTNSRSYYLRVLPLGASITWGSESSTGNGYRKPLRDQLRYAGWKVAMVGSRRGGLMKDNSNEGWPGLRIDQINDKANASLQRKPNLVLLNAGTNDCVQDYDIDHAGDRINEIVDKIFLTVPNSTLVLSTLLPHAYKDQSVQRVNTQIRNLVRDRQEKGDQIVLADMYTGFLTLSDLADGTHPNDHGYEKMGSVWYNAILEAESKDFLAAPQDTGIPDDGIAPCPAQKSNPMGPLHIQTADLGLAEDDGPFYPEIETAGLMTVLDQTPALGSVNSVQFLPLVGALVRKRMDVPVWHVDSQGFFYAPNIGNGTFGEKIPLDIGVQCDHSRVRFADLSGRGIVDAVCLQDDKAVAQVSKNRGGDSYTFDPNPVTLPLPPPLDGNYEVYFGDIDGDGRADICYVVGGGSNIHCWRNSGPYGFPTYWTPLVGGLTQVGAQYSKKGAEFQLVDVNNDGRADIVWIGKDDKITFFMNTGHFDSEDKPLWSDSHAIHFPAERVSAQDRIRFGRIYGVGVPDIVLFKTTQNDESTSPREFTNSVQVYKSLSRGGTEKKGDGVRYANMRGLASDDLLWISPNGLVSILANDHNYPLNKVYKHVIDLKTERHAIHVADWDGDGLADFLVVDKGTGATRLFKNRFSRRKDTFTFTDEGLVIDGDQHSCSEGWGKSITDTGIQFADVNGDRRADYLCIQRDGRIRGYLNKKDGSKVSFVEVPPAHEFERSTMRFADINGDGRADLLTVSIPEGDISLFTNQGRTSDDVFTLSWDDHGIIVNNTVRTDGSTVQFPKLRGHGRADFAVVSPTDAEVVLIREICPPGNFDDGPIRDPKLPLFRAPTMSETDFQFPFTQPEVHYLPGSPNYDICMQPPSFRNQALWNQHGTGIWLEEELIIYDVYSHEWPASVPNTIAHYPSGIFDPDANWDWHPSCESIRTVCHIPGLDQEDLCINQYHQVFVLTALEHFARLLQTFRKTMGLLSDHVAANLPSIFEEFKVPVAPDSTYEPSLPLELIDGGILASLTAFANTPEARQLRAVSPVLVMVKDLLTRLTFTDITDSNVTISPADLKNTSRLTAQIFDPAFRVMSSHFDELLVNPPLKSNPNYQYSGDPNGLTRLLRSGVFANTGIARLPARDSDVLKTALAPLISEWWNNQRMFVLRIPMGGLHLQSDDGFETLIFNPCRPQHDTVPPVGVLDNLFGRIVCAEGGESYAILPWTNNITAFYSDYGVSRLPSYGYDILSVSLASHRAQIRSGSFKPRSFSHFIKLMVPNTNSLVGRGGVPQYWNLPVCDLDEIDMSIDDVICVEAEEEQPIEIFPPPVGPAAARDWSGKKMGLEAQDGRPINPFSEFDRCFMRVVLKSCKDMVVGDEQWPYRAGP